MSRVTLDWRLHPGQVRVWCSPARFQAVGCGRRWGKTRLGWKKILTAALRDPGPYAWIAPWYKELKPATDVIDETTPRAMFSKYSKLTISGVPVYRSIYLPNGSEILFFSADKKDSLRGFKFKGIVVDEAPSVDRETWEKEIAPALIDYGGWALFIGSPKGRNWFYELYVRGQDREAFPEWESWQASSYENAKDGGGFLDRRKIDNIRDQLPETTARQEIDGEFLEGEGVVFRKVDDATEEALGLIPRGEGGHRYTVGVDLAKHRDFTVLVAIDNAAGQVRGYERFNDLDWTLIKARVKSFSEKFPGVVWIDSTGVGDPIYDDLYRMGVPVRDYYLTNRSKAALVEKLSIYLDQGLIKIPPSLTIMLNELKAFEYEMSPAGNVTYGAPEGLHDDTVIGLGLSVWGRPRYREPQVSVEEMTR